METINPSMEYRNKLGLDFLRKTWPRYEKQNKLINKKLQAASRSEASKNRWFSAYHSLYVELYHFVETYLSMKNRKKSAVVVPNFDYSLIGELLYRQVIETKSSKELIGDIRNGLETIMIAVGTIQEAERQLEIIEDHDTVLILGSIYFFYRAPYTGNKGDPSREELYQAFIRFNPVYTSYGYYKERLDELKRKRYIAVVKDRKGGSNGGPKRSRISLTKKGKQAGLKLFDPSTDRVIR